MKKVVLLLILSASLWSCDHKPSAPKEETPPVAEAPAKYIPTLSYSVKAHFPHDSTAFTEGFLFHKGQLFESTGAAHEYPQTRSLFGIVDMKTGKIAVKAELDKAVYFGEGIVILNNKLYQVTYKNKQGFVYDANSFKRLKDFSYTNEEGWGLTTDSASIIMSDGTSMLTYFEPDFFRPVKSLAVTLNGQPVDRLNELEYIKGYLYANIWMTTTIVKIDPKTGEVVATLDLSALSTDAHYRYSQSLEMNGIAYDPATDKIYVTGKLWPKMYQIEFEH
jgi:glutamine cyclotransferase